MLSGVVEVVVVGTILDLWLSDCHLGSVNPGNSSDGLFECHQVSRAVVHVV